MSVADVIDHLVGLEPGGHLDMIRRARAVARDNTQASYAALFAPDTEADMTKAERHALASFVAGVHRDPSVASFYASSAPGLADTLALEIERATSAGPYGGFPAGPLSVEDTHGPTYKVGDPQRPILGPRLSAAFEHAHMLVFHPRDSSPAWLQSLLDAGWSTTGIVTLSQLVAFLSFQVRVVHGLRVMQGVSA